MDIQALRSVREGHRRVISRQLEKIEEAKREDTLVEFNTILGILSSKVAVISSLNEKILSQTDIANIEDEIVASEEYMLELDIKLNRLRLFSRENQSSLHGSSSGDSNLPPPLLHPSVTLAASSASQSSQFYRLPKLTIPIFSGDILKWQTFWDSFESTVHLNNNLTDVQKFSYLQSQLDGDAARTIGGFPLTNANYSKAVNLLKERFGQSHKIKHAYMQSLIQIPAPKNNIHSLRHFYDQMETYIRGLESLGECQDSYGNLLVPIVIGKLPSDICKQLAREKCDGNWNLQDLRSALFKEINILEAGNQSTESKPEEGMYTASFLTNARKSDNRNTYQGKSNVKPDRTVRKCVYCEDSHCSTDCTKVSDTASRVSIVKQKKLCFNCLSRHMISDCKSRNRCRFCKRKHHSSICDKRSNDSVINQTQVYPSQTENEESAVLYTSAKPQQAILLKTAVAKVCSPSCITDANILFDEGAQRSFISEKLAKELQLHPDGMDTMNISTFGDNTRKVQHLNAATIYLMTDDGNRIPLRVLIVPIIATPLSNTFQQSATKLPYLRGLKLAHPVHGYDTFEISLLIGADFYWDIVQDRTVRGDGPTAVQSRVGYLLSGPLTVQDMRPAADRIQTVITAHIQDNFDLERFWSIESTGIGSTNEDRSTLDDLRDYQEHCITFSDGKYTAKLPWKQNHPALPDNYIVSKRRTENVLRRLYREPEMFEKYRQIIEEQEKRGFIEKVTYTDTPQHSVYYIPPHPVRKESSTTPIRIVFDCSCRVSEDVPSLNDCLESTPPRLNELPSLLLRFRYHRYAVSTDIEKAFLQIGLDEHDRDFTRFLWLSDPSNPQSPLTTYRFRVVLFGATCSPFILNATILKHVESNRHITSTHILERDLYVDNIISSFEKETDVLTYFRESRDLMSSAGFNLRSWSSNNKRLKSMATSEGVLDADTTVKVLGMRWDPEADTLRFSEQNFTTSDLTTKRLILQQSSKIFDPLGLLSPVTVRAKLLIQDLWKQKHEWDTPLPDSTKETWNAIAKDLNSSTGTQLQRWNLHGDSHTAQDNTALHVFVDASTRSYGAAAYLVKNQTTTLLMAKNCVAPIKVITLPRLELMAAVVGARLADYIQQSIPVNATYLWSDSQIVLHWLQSKKTLKRFVQNRVQEIKDLSKEASWNYCPTDQISADLLTRGISTAQLRHSTLWWLGPSWLKERSEWPTSDINTLQINADVGTVDAMHSAIHTPHRDVESHRVNVINLSRFSDYKKLLRVTAYVQRFIRNCRTTGSTREYGPLGAHELTSAENYLIRTCQESSYMEEISSIRANSRRLPLVRQLRLFLSEDGFLRCGGRLHNAPLDDKAKFPILLPSKHQLTRLIISNAHRDQFHTGVNGTVTYLRQTYWIPAIRQCVKTILRKCTICRKISGRPYPAPDPAPLPACRLKQSDPFTVTGVDFTGALYVKESTGLEKKVYVCLFTCASTRAVHLEVVTDLKVETFLQALRRFISRKSCPVTMVSDNASTYLAAANLLQALFKSPTLQTSLSQKGITWIFIPKRAPWYGGWWERLIGITKTTIKKILGRSLVSLETLQTVVTEVEALINDRPLTYVSSNVTDPEPLTPAHLLYGRKLNTLPYQREDLSAAIPALSHTLANKRYRQQTQIIEKFWSRWRYEYLTDLRERHGMTGNNVQTIKAGDIVQVHDDTPRMKWKLAVIEELIMGNDGLVRAARIRTDSGSTTRPIVKLYPIETVQG